MNVFSPISNPYVDNLPGDPIIENNIRQVTGAAYSRVNPTPPRDPSLIHANALFAKALGLKEADLQSEAFLNIMSGSTIQEGSKPYAMCYGGHQFGHWAGQLGDGRAINLFDLEHDDKRWTLQLKGAGKTPYSRSADGLAVLRSSIREYLCSEAMYHLGVPTTRALSLASSGEQVMRDVMYDGNPALEKGAIVCRVAPSFVRFGNFQIFHAREDADNLKRLADFTIDQYFPEIQSTGKERYVELLRAVAQSTMNMIIHWQRVGFVHGVMNTDNMSIHGLTIDYGPYGWLEPYDPTWTPNTTDRQNRRYRYGNQPTMALWNLAQLASALYRLVEDEAPLKEVLEWYQDDFSNHYFQMLAQKLGLEGLRKSDVQLAQDLLDVLPKVEVDMTIFFRSLADCKKSDFNQDVDLEMIKEAFYQYDNLPEDVESEWKDWMHRYRVRIADQALSDQDRVASMNQINPKYVLRNYIAQMIIDKADQGDYAMLDEVYSMLQNPYTDQPKYDHWYARRPEWARHKVGCSMLSCSS